MNTLLAAMLLAAQATTMAAPRDTGLRLEGEYEQGALMRGQAPADVVKVTVDGREVSLAPDKRFLLGFDRDAPESALLAVNFSDGTQARQVVFVAPRRWDVQHVDVARRPGGAAGDFMRIREPELARIAAARAVRSDAQGWRQQFIWPARGRISGRFGSQRVYRGEPGSYHNGVDVGAGAGAPVVAPADGVVVLATATPFTLEGNLVIVDHGHGLNSAFLHLSRIDVREGQTLRQGDRVGAVGATGRATGPHLHWALTWNGARLDPERVVPPMN